MFVISRSTYFVSSMVIQSLLKHITNYEHYPLYFWSRIIYTPSIHTQLKHKEGFNFDGFHSRNKNY